MSQVIRVKVFKRSGTILEKSSQTYLIFSNDLRITESENDGSRKDAKDAKFGEMRKYFFFALLASLRPRSGHAWRDKFVEVVLLKI